MFANDKTFIMEHIMLRAIFQFF